MKCKFKKGDIVITKYDVLDCDAYPLDKSGRLPNLGKEIFTIHKFHFWKQGEGFIVYGKKSNVRNKTIWHHEDDLELYKS